MHNIRRTSVKVKKSVTEFLALTDYMYQLKNIYQIYSRIAVFVYIVFYKGQESRPFHWSTSLKINHPL